MDLFVHTLVSGLVQFALAVLIAFVWWWFSARHQWRFTQWIGLTRIVGGTKTFSFMLLTLLILFGCGWLVIQVIPSTYTYTASTQFGGLGWAALPSVLVHALLNTSGWEEIFFRGLLLKRLMGKCGLLVANALQAVLFGLMHGVPLFLMTGMSVVQAAVITLFTGLAGWCMGYMNEKACARVHLPELDGAYAVQCGVGNAISLQHALKHGHDLQRYGRIGASHHVTEWERSSGVRRLRHVGTQAQTWFTRHAYIGGCYYHFRKNKEAGWLEPSAAGFMRIEPEPCGGGVRVPFGARDTRRINPGLGGIGIEPGMGAIVKRD